MHAILHFGALYCSLLINHFYECSEYLFSTFVTIFNYIPKLKIHRIYTHSFLRVLFFFTINGLIVNANYFQFIFMKRVK